MIIFNERILFRVLSVHLKSRNADIQLISLGIHYCPAKEIRFYRYIPVTERNMVSHMSSYCLCTVIGLTYSKNIYFLKAFILAGRKSLFFVCSLMVFIIDVSLLQLCNFFFFLIILGIERMKKFLNLLEISLSHHLPYLSMQTLSC